MSEPGEVWKLIQRADELVKYAGNRDPATAYDQARATLDDASAMTRSLDDEAQRAHFEKQIALRRADLDRYSSS